MRSSRTQIKDIIIITKSTRPKAGDVAAFFCHFLGDHDVKTEKVLKKADLVGADWDDPDSVPAIYTATTKFLPRMLRSDCAAESAADDSAAGAASDSDDRVRVSFCICGERTGSVFLSLHVSSGFLRGGHVTHNLSSLPGLASYFLNQLRWTSDLQGS
jgi:hypothetical protein